MALTRAFLKSMSLNDEQINAIVEANSESLEGIKAERDKYKAKADDFDKVKEELDALKATAKESGNYEKLKKEFDDYKAEVTTREVTAAKKAALTKIAKDAGLSEAGIAKAVKYTDLSTFDLDDNGEVKDGKTLLQSMKDEWSDYVATAETHGAKISTPPAASPPDYETLSDADYYKATYEAGKKGK